MQEKAISAVSTAAPYAEVKVPTQAEAFDAMIALQKQARYEEGASWTNGTEEEAPQAHLLQISEQAVSLLRMNSVTRRLALYLQDCFQMVVLHSMM